MIHFSKWKTVGVASNNLVGPILVLIAMLTLIGVIYSLAWSGTWHFDDGPNLRGLEDIDDFWSAADFVTSGQAGPLGRPISLVTFAMQSNDWPQPRSFLIVNTIIHLFNGAFVFCLAWILAGLLAPNSSRRGWFALAVATCWASSPFLASSSLMVIQRMATLTASFVFLGLIGYLAGRLLMERRSHHGLIFALSSLTLCTVLASLSKENGALLPVLALIIEKTIIVRSPRTLAKLPRTVEMLWLILPTLLILAYLCYRGFTAPDFARRDFSVSERLLTQSRAIWDYILNLLIPRVDSNSPFSDTFTPSRSLLDPATTPIALLGLLTACALALFCRSRLPFVAFGVLFFLAAHLLESTVISLELYFAHRSYLPAFGIYFLVLYAPFFHWHEKSKQRLLIFGVAGYITSFMVVLASTTDLWGRPDVAAEIWFAENPSSRRAAQFASDSYLSQGDPRTALRILEATLTHRPNDQTLAVRTLRFCSHPDQDLQRANRLRYILQNANWIANSVPYILETLVTTPEEERCSTLDDEALLNLLSIASLRANIVGATVAEWHLKVSQALIHYRQSNIGTALELMLDAHDLRRDRQSLELVVYLMIQSDDEGAATKFLASERDEVSGWSIDSWFYRRNIDSILTQLDL